MQNRNRASCFKIQVDSIFIEKQVLSQKKLNEKSRKIYIEGFIYTSFFLAKIVIAQTWPSRVSDFLTKTISEQSTYWVTFHRCHSATFSSSITMKKISYSKEIKWNEGINYNEENKLFKEENQLKYKKGLIKVYAR